MPDNNALVLSDNENGTQSATWTPVEEVTPDQKVLIGAVDPVSGTMQATWNPSSDAAVFKDGTFTENGAYDAQEDDCDGYKTVTVEVPEPVLGTKTITENGTYTAASEEKDGFSEVTVAVPGVEFAASPAAFTLLSNIRNLDVEIPSGVTSIGGTAFGGCAGLTSVEIPSSVTAIGNSAFNGCTGLTSIEIPSGVTTISADAFAICTNLTSIVVHKAEGSIANAPWGATNATVTWDG